MREVGALLLALALAAAPGATRAAPSAERQAELLHRLTHDCGSCHGLTLKGGLGPPLVPFTLADKPDELLIEVILNGLPGTPMPPWDFEVSREEAGWLVRHMKGGR